MNNKIVREIRSLKVIRWVHPARSGAQLTTPPGRAWTNRIVKASRTHLTHSNSTDATSLAAPPTAELRGLHAAIISADCAVAVSSWLAQRLQPMLKISQTCLTVRSSALHLQVSNPPVQVTDVAMRTHSTRSAHSRYVHRQIRHAFSIQSPFQTVPRC